jgi:hypothetical protein
VEGRKKRRPSKPQATVRETQLHRIRRITDQINKTVEEEYDPRSGERKRKLGALVGALTRAVRAALKAGKAHPTEILEQLEHLQVDKLPKRYQRLVQERMREAEEAQTQIQTQEEKEEGKQERGKDEGGSKGKGYVVERARKIFEGRVGEAEGEAKEIIDHLLEEIKPLKGKYLVNSRCEAVHTLFVFLLACLRSASDDILTLIMLWRFNPKHIEKALLQCLSHLSSKLIKRGYSFKWEAGRTYHIRYRSRKGKPGWRKIRVEEAKKKYIKAHCFKKGETRHFRRKRTAMEKVIPLYKPPKPQKNASQKIFWGWISPPTPAGTK